MTPNPTNDFPECGYLDVAELSPSPSSSARQTLRHFSLPNGSASCKGDAKKPISTRKKLPPFRGGASSSEGRGQTANCLHDLLHKDPTLQNVCIHTTKEYHDMKSAYIRLFKEKIEAKDDPSYPQTDHQKRIRVAQFLDAVASFSPLDDDMSVDGIVIPDLPVKDRLMEMGLENMKDVEFNLIAWEVMVRNTHSLPPIPLQA